MIKIFEKYNDLSEIKDNLFITAVKTYDLEIIKLFLNRGYNINVNGVLYEACENDEIFKFMLENGIDVENQIKNSYEFRNQMRDLNTQEILIDFGYDMIIYNTVGFNQELKKNIKYADIIDMYEKSTQYNL